MSLTVRSVSFKHVHYRRMETLDPRFGLSAVVGVGVTWTQDTLLALFSDLDWCPTFKDEVSRRQHRRVLFFMTREWLQHDAQFRKSG